MDLSTYYFKHIINKIQCIAYSKGIVTNDKCHELSKKADIFKIQIIAANFRQHSNYFKKCDKIKLKDKNYKQS